MACALLIRHADVYTPEPMGIQDVLVVNGIIIRIAEKIDENSLGIGVEVIEARGRKVVPGYVDQHVHIIGGGGEAGPYSRTPEVQLSDVVSSGVTTLIGVLGTDGTGRHPETLLAKARGLETEGITAYMLTGSYEIPLRTITGDARRDVILIDKVLGIGEIALSDHRSSQPTKDELKRILTQARLGGYIDLTSGIRESDGFPSCIKPSDAIRICMEEGVPMDRLTMSSDGNGSMSVPLPEGGARLLVTRLSSLHEEIRDAVMAGVPLETAIRVCGENPARANGLWPQKGCIRVDSDADMLILSEELKIDTVIARGRTMVQGGEVLVKGTFEE